MEKVSKTLFGHLDVLYDLVERIDKNEGSPALIEMDMLLAELRSMYDSVYRLSRAEVHTLRAEEPESPVDNPSPAEDYKSAPAAPVVAAPDYVEAPSVAVASAVEQTETHDVPSDDEIAVPPVDDDIPPVDDETGILMTDTDAEPVYAAEQNDEPAQSTTADMPTMEEVEGAPNDTLFEEEQVNRPTEAEAPKTLWDKLQTPNGNTSIADRFVAARTVSDMLSEEHVNENGKPSDAAVEQQIVDNQLSDIQAEQRAENNEPTGSPSSAMPEEDQNTETAQPSLFDYLRTANENAQGRTIGDSFGNIHGNPESSSVAANKVSDLRTVININDKFCFMNELFHNNMKGYNDFILRLNAIDSREEALSYVEGIAAQYAWDNESLAVKTFYSIFDRKF